MTDRRRLWSNGRVAAASLADTVQAERYVAPDPAYLAAVVADLCDAPSGRRDRQLLRGSVFNRLETRDGWVFGYTDHDGYAGWVEAACFDAHPPEPPKHHVCVGRSYAKTSPGLKEMGGAIPLPHGARLIVREEHAGWSRIAWAPGDDPIDLYVPSPHLRPIAHLADDPVDVAAAYWGTPYLWGGNSAFGIDCSGLVQAACHACGIPCPGDSDMQHSELGVELPDETALRRGDLLFWSGHVAWVVDPETVLHANAFHMAVAYEPLHDAVARIAAQGDGPVTARKRLERRS